MRNQPAGNPSFLNAIGLFASLWLVVAAVALPAPGQLLHQADKAPQGPIYLEDASIDFYRVRLLDAAFQAASSFPVNPHIKNRSRAQTWVVQGALEAGQANLAKGYADKILNWQRGESYAFIAEYLFEQEQTQHLDYFLEQAMAHSHDPKQGWRHDRVKARVSYIRSLMAGSLEAFEEDDTPSEPVDEGISQDNQLDPDVLQEARARVDLSKDDEFAQAIEVLEGLVATQGYDAIIGALHAYAGLADRYFTDEKKRTLIEEKIREAWQPLSALIRYEIMFKLAETAIGHEDFADALRWIAEAGELKDQYRWTVDFDLPLRAELAKMLHRAGDTDRALQVLAEAEGFADAQIDSLATYKRADALRPLAEAYAVLGQSQRALELFRRVYAFGVINPNIRPRVNDLTNTCVSMAVHGVEPDEALWLAIKGTLEDLGNL